MTEALRNSRDFPQLVWAYSPWQTAPGKRAPIRLWTSSETMDYERDARERTRQAEYCGNIHGGIVAPGSVAGSLLDAYALFQGLKRPHDDVDLDGNVYVYVYKPAHTFALSERSGKGGQAPTCTPSGASSVFVVYAKIPEDRTSIAGGVPDQHRTLVFGTIEWWEWTKHDGGTQPLPLRHAARYKQRIW